MDRNTFTGLFLIMIIMGASIYFWRPNKAELNKKDHTDSVKRGDIKPSAASIEKVNDSARVTAVKTIDSATLKAPFGAATVGTEKLITLENEDILVKLTNHGGRVYSVQLKKYLTFDKKPLILFEGDHNHFGTNLIAGNNNINTDKLYFNPNAGALQVAGKDSGSVTMRLTYSPTQYVDYIYSLKGSGFKLGLTIKETGLDQVLANAGSLNIDWSADMRRQEKDIKQERQYSTIYYYNTDHDLDYLSAGKDDQAAITDKKMQWVSFQAHFFSGVLISKNGFSKSNLSIVTSEPDTAHTKQMSAGLAVPRMTDGSYPMEFYFGPNQYYILKAQGYHLERQIYMGWAPLAFINRYAVLPVFNILSKLTSNYGLIILALTIILKLVLSPLTYKSYLSMAKMRVLKPEMDEIKGKVGDDNPTLLQQEYLKLYKKAGVNPLGGCLPLVIQMPIVIAFFRFFPSLFELRGTKFFMDARPFYL